MSLQELATTIGAHYDGPICRFKSVSTDTRTLQGGELFVAVPGPNFDANDFVDAAVTNGAVAALTSRDVAASVPTLVVDDTVAALGQLARSWRQRFELPVVGVTGSNGKTTVKEMIGSILTQAFSEGVVSRGNLNNHIGLPLSILALNDTANFGVFEMGMNHQGEILALTKICQPTIAVINNAAAAHLEGLGSVRAVAAAKAEIFQGLPQSGVAVINADDEHFTVFENAARAAGVTRIVSFGLDNPEADFHATYRPSHSGNEGKTEVSLSTPSGVIEFTLAVPGRHNASNAAAAAACAFAANANANSVVAGLSDYRPIGGRLGFDRVIGKLTLMDDSYNANPASVRAAIDVLAARLGQKVFVLGQMAELGSNSAALHRQVGAYAGAAGVDAFFGLGQLAEEAVTGFGAGGRYFDDAQSLVAAIVELGQSSSVDAISVVVKGSRSMQMERVLADVVTQLGVDR